MAQSTDLVGLERFLWLYKLAERVGLTACSASRPSGFAADAAPSLSPLSVSLREPAIGPGSNKVSEISNPLLVTK
jgi:hypothetical protein